MSRMIKAPSRKAGRVMIGLVAGATVAMSPVAEAAAQPADAGSPSAETVAARGHKIDHCYGHKVKSWWIDPIRKIGRMDLWYSTLSGGTSCLMVYDTRPGKHWVEAEIWKGKKHKRYSDKGHYEYYAGGVRIKHTKRSCIDLYGVATVQGKHPGYWLSGVHPRSGTMCH